MKFWTQNESIGILYDSNEYFGILPYMFLGNWVYVQFWSSAKIHQTSLRFQDTYVCAEDKIRYYKDVALSNFKIFQMSMSTIILNYELNNTFNCNKIDRPDKISKKNILFFCVLSKMELYFKIHATIFFSISEKYKAFFCGHMVDID